MKTRKLFLIATVTVFILVSFISAGNIFAQDEGNGGYGYGTDTRMDTNDQMMTDDPMDSEDDMNMDNPMNTEDDMNMDNPMDSEDDTGNYYEDPENQGLNERNYNDESGYNKNAEDDTEAPMDR